MHFQFLGPVLLLASAFAAPAAPETPEVASIAPASDAPLEAPLNTPVLDKRAKGWITLYQGENFDGDFGHIVSDNACHDVKKKKTHSSYQIFNAQCNVYENSNCKGAKATLGSSSRESVAWSFTFVKTDINTPANWWNNRLSSVICWDY